MTRFELPARRKVDHLTLHRQQRKISIREYHALSPAERLEMIRQARGKEKYDLILNAPDAEQLVPALHPQDLYLTVQEVGPEYAVELLMLTTSDQLTTLLDLDCWEGDNLSEKSVLQWLELLLESGEEKVCRSFREMEPELLTMFLKKQMRITRGPESWKDEDADNPIRLENLYEIEYRNEDASKIVGALLTILFGQEQSRYLLLMEMVRAELDTSLEEETYQSRGHRLLDLGFTTPQEARAIYAYVDPEQFTPSSGKHFDLEGEGLQHPGALLSRAQPSDLLAEILAGGLNHELATELCFLANRKMSAERIDVSDPQAVEQSLQHLYRTLNLGLEHLAARDAADAGRIFNDCYLQQLFQLGHSLTEQRKRRAREILQSSPAAFLDGPYRRFVETLNGTPPRLFSGIRLGLGQDEKAFQTRDDLLLADQYLQQIAVQRQLFDGILPFALPTEESCDLSNCQPEELADLTLSDLFLTALANRLLGREFSPRPIPVTELGALHALICADRKLSATLRTETCAALEAMLSGAGQFADFCLDIWQEEFCALKIEQVDPRYLSGLIMRL
jgi:hypothetical protein